MGCAALVFCWQLLTIHFNYQGHWNALFCTGEKFAQPPQLAEEHLYIFKNSTGYDGQVYHYIAHDPFLTKGFTAYVDNPRFRYRRILVPLAAYSIALGQSNWVDGAYYTVVLACVFLGGWWLSLYFAHLGFRLPWAFAFLLIPSTLISIDRMTVDVALAAACVGLVLFLARDRQVALYTVLAAAPLIRETGLLLIAGYVLSLLWSRKIQKAAIFSTAALPALGWYLYVQLHTAPYSRVLLSAVPLTGSVHRVIAPTHYSLPALVAGSATLLDYAALTGVGIAIVLAIRMAFRRRTGPLEINIYLFALLATFLADPELWLDAYAFTRTLSPLLLLLAANGVATRRWIDLIPLLLAVPRIVLQLMPQVLGILT